MRSGYLNRIGCVNILQYGYLITELQLLIKLLQTHSLMIYLADLGVSFTKKLSSFLCV